MLGEFPFSFFQLTVYLIYMLLFSSVQFPDRFLHLCSAFSSSSRTLVLLFACAMQKYDITIRVDREQEEAKYTRRREQSENPTHRTNSFNIQRMNDEKTRDRGFPKHPSCLRRSAQRL